MTWNMRTLGEICDEAGGEIRTGPFGSQLHRSDYSEHGTPVVMPQDLVNDRVSTANIARVAASHVERLAQHRLSPGDIVYGRRGDIGRHALITDREAGWLCGTGCLRISAGDGVIDPKYLHYYLSDPAVIEWIYNQAVGATMPNLNTSILRSIPIRYPTLPAQRRIAGILSAYDDLIENNTRRIAILEEMAQAIYREWFVHFRFPGHEQVEMVESELGPIPAGWEISKISEVASVYRGRSYRSSELVEDGGLPFLNLKCIARDGGFRRDGLKRYNGKYKDTQVAGPDDMVMAVTDMTQERRIIARVARVPALDERRMVFSMDLVKIVPSAAIERHFLYGMLRYSGFAEKVKHYANGANVLHLSPQHVEDYAFLLPPSRLQQAYAACVSPLYELGDVLGNKNENLRKTRDLLLPKLISGEIDVEALEREPAEAIA